MTTATDLRVLDDDELESRLAETQQELFNLRFQRVTGQLDNTARIRHLRREVARMKTIRREREIGAELSETGELAPAFTGRVRATAPPAVVEAPAQEPPGPGAEPDEAADVEGTETVEAEPEEATATDEGPDADEPVDEAEIEEAP
jgi:large subunit ribosomal protein L29